MKVYGLTGGIATGKSTVEEALRGLGVPSLDADHYARAVVEPGLPAYREIVEEFGREVLDDEQRIDRAALGREVYRDADSRRRLEELTHPRIWTAIWKECARLEHRGAPIAVVSAALLVESGYHTRFDGMLVVHCPPEEQLRRIQTRDGFTAEQALRRVEAQMPISDKIAIADWLIDTTGTRAETALLVAALVRRWREE